MKTNFNGTIRYPVLKYHDKQVQKKINNQIASAVFQEDEYNDSILHERLTELADFTYILEHTVTYNKNYILSFSILTENCGAYCVSYVTYLNFDLRTGESVELNDLVLAEKKDSFEMVLENRIRQELGDYKKSELDSLLFTDSTAYDWVMESVQSCLESIIIVGFAIYPDKIEFENECNFPHAIKAYSPNAIYSFSPKELTPFLKGKYLSLFKKR